MKYLLALAATVALASVLFAGQRQVVKVRHYLYRLSDLSGAEASTFRGMGTRGNRQPVFNTQPLTVNSTTYGIIQISLSNYDVAFLDNLVGAGKIRLLLERSYAEGVDDRTGGEFCDLQGESTTYMELPTDFYGTYNYQNRNP